MVLVNLDSWGLSLGVYFRPVSLDGHMRMLIVLSPQHTAEGSHWMSLTSEQPRSPQTGAFVWLFDACLCLCTHVCFHTRACIWVIV